MLSPRTPSRSASRIASTTTRCLLSPASDATWRCFLTDTDHLLAPSNGLTIVQRTSHSTGYDVRCTSQRESRLEREEALMEIRQRPDAGTRPGPETSPAGAVTMRGVGATAIALAAAMAIQDAVPVGAPTFGHPIEEVLAWHAQNRVAVAIAVGLEALNLPLLLGFVTGLHGLVGRRGGAGAGWSRLAVAAGAALSAVFALSAVLWIGVVLSAGELAEPSPAFELVWQLHAAAFALALPALGTTFIGAAL